MKINFKIKKFRKETLVMNNLSVIKSAKNLQNTKINIRNRYPKDEFTGLSSEEKLLKAIFNPQENTTTTSDAKPVSNLYSEMTAQSEIRLIESDNIYLEVKETEKEKTSETGYRIKKIQRKKKYSAMAKQDMTDFEDFIAVNDNFHCDYSSVRNSLLYSR